MKRPTPTPQIRHQHQPPVMLLLDIWKGKPRLIPLAMIGLVVASFILPSHTANAADSHNHHQQQQQHYEQQQYEQQQQQYTTDMSLLNISEISGR